jgi:hypothetical protein
MSSDTQLADEPISPDTAVNTGAHEDQSIDQSINNGFSNTNDQHQSATNGHQQMVDSFAPLKLNLRWKVTKENPIFEEDEGHIMSFGSKAATSQGSRFWRHPVRYIEYAEKNLFRTVMIDYIPIGTTYQDILANICGGALERIDLVGPIGNATGYMTARVVFHHELPASTTASYARDYPIKIKGQQVRVWQVITQTYPKNRQLERDVFENMYTRLLLVNLKNAIVTDEVKDQMRALLPIKLERLTSSIIEFSKTSDGFDLIEFTSVAVAAEAMEMLRTDPNFSGIELDFEDDPCAEPYPFGGLEL